MIVSLLCTLPIQSSAGSFTLWTFKDLDFPPRSPVLCSPWRCPPTSWPPGSSRPGNSPWYVSFTPHRPTPTLSLHFFKTVLTYHGGSSESHPTSQPHINWFWPFFRFEGIWASGKTPSQVGFKSPTPKMARQRDFMEIFEWFSCSKYFDRGVEGVFQRKKKFTFHTFCCVPAANPPCLLRHGIRTTISVGWTAETGIILAS